MAVVSAQWVKLSGVVLCPRIGLHARLKAEDPTLTFNGCDVVFV
jgi:hypothetical protein